MRDSANLLEFDHDQVFEQAVGNAHISLLVLFAYAREQGHDPAAAARFVGERFAPGWDDFENPGADAIVRLAGLNVLSTGGEIRDLRGNAQRAELVTSGWPDPEIAAFVGVALEDADHAFTVFEPIAERVGLRSSWQRHGETITLVFERP